MTGVHGALAFVTAVFGYALAGALMVSSLLKMMFPQEIGLWIGPDYDIGFRSGEIPGGQEVLGKWFEPISFGLGLLFLSVTTVLIRALLPRFKQWRTSALSQLGVPGEALKASAGLARRVASEFRSLYTTIRQQVSAATAKRPDQARDLRG
jgi:hypothetical protein